MNTALASSLLVLLIFGNLCHQAPATTRHYEIGNVYTYDYVLGLEINEPSAAGDNGPPLAKTASTVGYKILTQVQVRPVWQNEPGGSILEISLLSPKLQIKSRKLEQPEGFRDHTSQLDDAQQHPFYVHWKDGAVHKAFHVSSDDNSLVNIKKGIANLLQVPANDQGTAETIQETTTMGNCKIQYENPDNQHVTKTIYGACEQHAASQKFPFSTHPSKVLGASVDSEVTVKTSLSREGVIIEDAQVVEKHIVRTAAKPEVGAYINASQSFKLAGSASSSGKVIKASSAEAAIKELAKSSGAQLTSDTLVVTPDKVPFCEAYNCKSFDALLKSITPENVATTKMASAFLQLVAKIRESNTQELEKVLKTAKQRLPHMLDAVAASGSLEAHKIVMKILDFEDDEMISNPERYLLALSMSPSPSPEVLPELFALAKKGVKSDKVQETLVLTVAKLAQILKLSTRQVTGSPAIAKLVGSEVEEFLVSSINACKEPACQQMYLRALKNLQSESTIKTIFTFIENADSKTSVAAMKALHSFPDEVIPKGLRPALLRIVQQLGSHKFDSSVRTLALDLILRNKPTKDEIKRIIHLLEKKDRVDAEVAAFMWNRIQEFGENNPELQKFTEDIITEEGIKDYHHLSPKGLSTAFSRSFISGPSGNSSFSNAIEMNGKLLKRSSFDVYVRGGNDSIQILSLGIFAGGLGSFASSDDGGGDAAEDDSESATAGMELSLLGVQMRPIVFFTGKGELMGLVWSGAGSERTTAVQGNVLLQDEKRIVPLYSGLVADVTIQGGLSFELAGQIQLSLWHRTANSLVENKAGLLLQSTIRVDTSFVKSRIDYTIGSEAALHFTSDVNFYDGVLMCLKLTQPDFVAKQNIHKTERIPGSKHKLRKAKYKTIPIPGITYALNKKNSQLCGVMYKDEL